MELQENSNLSPSSITWALLAGGGIVLIIGGMRAAAQIVNTLLLAYVVTLLFTPFLIWLRKKHVPAFLAIIFILLSLLVITLVLIWFVGISVHQFEAKLPQYEARVEDALRNLLPPEDLLPAGDEDIPATLMPESLSLGPLLTSTLQYVPTVLSSISNFTSHAMMIALIVFFALLEATSLAKRITGGLGSDNRLLREMQNINFGVRKYIIIRTWTGLLAAAANTIALVALGIDFALLWGLLSFIMNYVPSVGFIIALIPPFILALVQFGLAKALIVLATYIVINAITDNIIAPRAMGHGLNLSPLAVFISLIFWAWVLGLVGALMAVPLLLITKIFLDRFDETRWLAVAISGDN